MKSQYRDGQYSYMLRKKKCSIRDTSSGVLITVDGGGGGGLNLISLISDCDMLQGNTPQDSPMWAEVSFDVLKFCTTILLSFNTL